MNLRPEIQQHVGRRLRAFAEGFRQNIALLGFRGVGKTYQLRQLQLLAPEGVGVIYCPLYQESARSLLKRFLTSVLNAGLRHEQDSSLESLLDEAQERLPKTSFQVRIALESLQRGAVVEAYSRCLQAVPALVEDTAQPCVLILDEFLYLESMGIGHAFQELGKRVMTWPAVMFVLASSAPYRAELILRERLHLLFGQFEILELSKLDMSGVKQWLDQAFYGFQEADPVKAFLAYWVGAYPLYLKTFVERLNELAGLSRSRVLNFELLREAVWDLLGTEHGRLQQWCAANLAAVKETEQRARATEALMELARGTRTMTDLAERIGKSRLADILQVLVEHDLAVRRGACWLIPDPILRCWLSHVLQVQRTGTYCDDVQAKQILDGALRKIWEQWLVHTQRTFAEEMVVLFQQFDEDTIALDSKTGRLPRFERIQALSDPAEGKGFAYLVADSQNKRWCATVNEHEIDEAVIARFDAFCRAQSPKPTRKVVIAPSGIQEEARTLAKAVNMWVWESDSLAVLRALYGAH
jgi:hypothetical protein